MYHKGESGKVPLVNRKGKRKWRWVCGIWYIGKRKSYIKEGFLLFYKKT